VRTGTKLGAYGAATTPAEPAPPSGERQLDLEVTIPGPSTTSIVDGYEVTMAGDPVPGESELGFAVEVPEAPSAPAGDHADQEGH
jgi:hypothetical protein